MLAAVLVTAWISRPVQDHVAEPQSQAEKTQEDYRGPSEGYWRPEFSARDTYAQWAMTGLALIATGISIVGVVLIRRTFEETKRTADAAFAAVEIAEKQFLASERPWIKVEVIDATLIFGSHGLILGKSPAARIRIPIGKGPVTDDTDAEQKAFCEQTRADQSEKGFFLFPNETLVETRMGMVEPYFQNPPARMTRHAGTAIFCVAYDSGVTGKTYITSLVLSARLKDGKALTYQTSPPASLGDLDLERHFSRNIAD